MTLVRSRRRRGFVVLTALAGLLILIVVSGLFLQHGIQGLRHERMQRLATHCDQIALSLRALSDRAGPAAGGQTREIAIGELLPPGAEGTAQLGPGGSQVHGQGEQQTVKCRIRIELGSDRLDRTYEWPAS